MNEVKVGLLGVTGAVGQRYISMLGAHPFFRLEALMGRESVGKKYREATHWLLPEAIPEDVAAMTVKKAVPESARDCDLVFSALPSEAARTVEPKFAEAGLTVISEASAFRMEPDVPLIIPEVNPQHLDLLKAQRGRRGWRGCIVTTPNCTVTGLAMVLKPLVDDFRLTMVVVTTMQAVSGAGYPGVPSLAIIENIIPFIDGEEVKVVSESKKILGTLSSGLIQPLELAMAVSCNRVQTIDGHLETVYCEFSDPVNVSDVISTLENFKGLPQELHLPTAPNPPLIVRTEQDRPQPRLDRMAGSVPGMSVVVGRIRGGVDERSVQLVLLSHNTIRGAAGTAILTAELMRSLNIV